MIQELVESCGGLEPDGHSRTVCELLDWKRPTGKLKAAGVPGASRAAGRRWDAWSFPDKRPGKHGRDTNPNTANRAWQSRLSLEGELSVIQPVVLEVVRSDEQRLLFRELVDRHHYGPRRSLQNGAHLRIWCTPSAMSGTGGGLCAVVESGVEDGGTRFVDWMGRCHARAEPAGAWLTLEQPLSDPP